MPKELNEKSLCVDTLRHTEYYNMQKTFDELYDKSKKGESFTNLTEIIFSRENILLAYRNIKTNKGSKTKGTDNLTIKDIEKISPDEMVEKVNFIVFNKTHGYRPKPVRRKEIPKPNGTTRPLGIPCIWDRIIQQCIKQVMEPICEAKFSENSFGFRPNRSTEQAIARTYQLLQRSKMQYIVEFDIKSFFDNVNHSKLIKQIWAMGIQDKKLIYIIKTILKAPIKMENGEIVHPTKGTPQGGIISPLLANIVLNELDHWVESQWQNSPVIKNYKPGVGKNNSVINSHAYEAMRKTKLKEMYIVRYADDFRIFCKTRDEAKRAKIAITQWLNERLKLEVSEEKTKIVNAKKKYSEFLGFKIKLTQKGNKQVIQSHICDKSMKRIKNELTIKAKNIARPRPQYKEIGEIYLYNSTVLGIQNYYEIATDISIDAQQINRNIMIVLHNSLNRGRNDRLVKTGRKLTQIEEKRYGKSGRLRFVAGTDEPIYPIGHVKHRNPMNKRKIINSYTVEGREAIHSNLKINTTVMIELMKNSIYSKSVELLDNKISLFSAQMGKCAVTGIPFVNTEEIHCHHKIPIAKGGTDSYENLILIHKNVHMLIHATNKETINKYLSLFEFNKKQIEKINNLRAIIGLEEIQTK